MSDRKPILIIRYDTLKECFLAFMRRGSITDDELKKERWTGYSGGRKFNISVWKWLNNHELKCWGYANCKTKTIHLWVDKDCKTDELIQLLAHEFAHLRQPKFKDKREEIKACRSGDDAMFAYQAAIEINDRKGGVIWVNTTHLNHVIYEHGNVL